MNKNGVTLIELMIIVVIVGILAVALAFSYQGWQGAYKVEKATKDLYTDLMDARGRAISRGEEYFADFNTPAPAAGQGRYRIIVDTNDNLVNNAGAGDDVLLTFPKTVLYVITWSGGGSITFDRRGIITTLGVIRLITTADADYDCINVAQTRINIGKWNTVTGVCDDK